MGAVLTALGFLYVTGMLTTVSDSPLGIDSKGSNFRNLGTHRVLFQLYRIIRSCIIFFYPRSYKNMARKLLVADDSVTIQKVIKLALSSEGYDILAVSGGKEAISAIEQEKPDIVLIDIGLPEKNAFEVRNELKIKQELSHIAFVLLASAFEKIDERKVDEAGFQGRLIKPFDPSQLRKMVSGLLKNIKAPKNDDQTSELPAQVPTDTSKKNSQSDGHAIPKGNFVTIEPGSIPVEELEADFAPLEQGLPVVEESSTRTQAQQLAEKELAPLGERAPMAVEQAISDTVFEPNTEPVAKPTEDDAIDQSLPSPDSVQVPPPPPGADFAIADFAINESEQNSEVDIEETEIESDNDIRELTDSTIQLSGMDEFQWSLDDSKKLKVPDLESTTSQTSFTDLATPPPPPLPTSIEHASEHFLDDGGSTFLTAGLSYSKKTSSQKIETPVKEEPSFKPETELTQPNTQQLSQLSSQLSRAEIEEIVRKDLRQAIEKLAKEVVPQVAESVIRQEIEKILSES